MPASASSSRTAAPTNSGVMVSKITSASSSASLHTSTTSTPSYHHHQYSHHPFPYQYQHQHQYRQQYQQLDDETRSLADTNTTFTSFGEGRSARSGWSSSSSSDAIFSRSPRRRRGRRRRRMGRQARGGGAMMMSSALAMAGTPESPLPPSSFASASTSTSMPTKTNANITTHNGTTRSNPASTTNTTSTSNSSSNSNTSLSERKKKQQKCRLVLGGTASSSEDDSSDSDDFGWFRGGERLRRSSARLGIAIGREVSDKGKGAGSREGEDKENAINAPSGQEEKESGRNKEGGEKKMLQQRKRRVTISSGLPTISIIPSHDDAGNGRDSDDTDIDHDRNQESSTKKRRSTSSSSITIPPPRSILKTSTLKSALKTSSANINARANDIQSSNSRTSTIQPSKKTNAPSIGGNASAAARRTPRVCSLATIRQRLLRPRDDGGAAIAIGGAGATNSNKIPSKKMEEESNEEDYEEDKSETGDEQESDGEVVDRNVLNSTRKRLSFGGATLEKAEDRTIGTDNNAVTEKKEQESGTYDIEEDDNDDAAIFADDESEADRRSVASASVSSASSTSTAAHRRKHRRRMPNTNEVDDDDNSEDDAADTTTGRSMEAKAPSQSQQRPKRPTPMDLAWRQVALDEKAGRIPPFQPETETEKRMERIAEENRRDSAEMQKLKRLREAGDDEAYLDAVGEFLARPRKGKEEAAKISRAKKRRKTLMFRRAREKAEDDDDDDDDDMSSTSRDKGSESDRSSNGGNSDQDLIQTKGSESSSMVSKKEAPIELPSSSSSSSDSSNGGDDDAALGQLVSALALKWRGSADLESLAKKHKCRVIQYRATYHNDTKSIRDAASTTATGERADKIRRGDLIVKVRSAHPTLGTNESVYSFVNWRLPSGETPAKATAANMASLKPIISESLRRTSIGGRRRGGSLQLSPPLFLDQSLSYEDKATVRNFVLDARAGTMPSQHFPPRRLKKTKKDDSAVAGVSGEKNNDHKRDLIESNENETENETESLGVFDFVGSEIDGGEHRSATTKGSKARKSAVRSGEKASSSLRQARLQSKVSTETGKEARTNEHTPARTLSARKRRKSEGLVGSTKVPPKRKTYESFRKKKLCNPVEFDCSDAGSSSFALIEGVGENSIHPLDSNLPFRGRLFELPGMARIGKWSAQLLQDSPHRLYSSALFRDKIDDLRGLRISFRHEDSKEMGRLADLIHSEHDLTFGVIEPVHSRLSGMMNQAVLGADELDIVTAVMEKSGGRVANAPYLGSLAIALFSGFETDQEQRDHGGDIAEDFLDGCRNLAARDSSRALNDLLPLYRKEMVDDDAPGPIPNSTAASGIDITGVSFPLKIQLWDSYWMIIAQDDETGEILAIDIVFEDPGESPASKSSSSSNSSFESHSCLPHHELAPLTEDNLAVHTKCEEKKLMRLASSAPPEEIDPHRLGEDEDLQEDRREQELELLSNDTSRSETEEENNAPTPKVGGADENASVDSSRSSSGNIDGFLGDDEEAIDLNKSTVTATMRSLSYQGEETGLNIDGVAEGFVEDDDEIGAEKGKEVANLGIDVHVANPEIEEQTEIESKVNESAREEIIFRDEAPETSINKNEDTVAETPLAITRADDIDDSDARAEAAVVATVLETGLEKPDEISREAEDEPSARSGAAKSETSAESSIVTADAAPRERPKVFFRHISSQSQDFDEASDMSIHTTESDYDEAHRRATPDDGVSESQQAPPDEAEGEANGNEPAPSASTLERDTQNFGSAVEGLQVASEAPTEAISKLSTPPHQNDETAHVQTKAKIDSEATEIERSDPKPAGGLNNDTEAGPGSLVEYVETAPVDGAVLASGGRDITPRNQEPEQENRNMSTETASTVPYPEPPGMAGYRLGSPSTTCSSGTGTMSVSPCDFGMPSPCDNRENNNTVKSNTPSPMPRTGAPLEGCFLETEFSTPSETTRSTSENPENSRNTMPVHRTGAPLDDYLLETPKEFSTPKEFGSDATTSVLKFFTPASVGNGQHESPENMPTGTRLEEDFGSTSENCHSIIYGAQDCVDAPQGQKDTLNDNDGATSLEPAVLSSFPFFFESPGDSRRRGEGCIGREARTIMFGGQDSDTTNVCSGDFEGNEIEGSMMEQAGTILSRPVFLQSTSYDEDEEYAVEATAPLRTLLFGGESPETVPSPTTMASAPGSSFVNDIDPISLVPFLFLDDSQKPGKSKKSRRLSASGVSCYRFRVLHILLFSALFLLKQANSPTALQQRKLGSYNHEGLSPVLEAPPKRSRDNGKYDITFISF